MIECYYKWCPNHEYNNLPRNVSEPFCMGTRCTVTLGEIEKFQEHRDCDMADVESAEG